MHADCFLQAIAEVPNDDVPRLIYADGLDEHGEATFAAVIRRQGEIARLQEENGGTCPTTGTRKNRTSERRERCYQQ